MVAWATKRKITYLSIMGGAVILLIVLPLFLLFYQKPTCFDGKRNGDELGIDCGGGCAILCSFEVIDPIVHWAQLFKVSDGVYSAVAYVENPNIGSDAENVPYDFKIYDANNQLITERTGTTFIPRNQKFAVFEGDIAVTDRIPKTAQFSFTQKPLWRKDTAPVPDIQVTNKAMMREDTTPRIEANLDNGSTQDLSNLEVTAIVYDGNNNAVAASRTYVDSIPSGKAAQAVFTWPSPFAAKLDICAVPTDTMLVLDRSGSMASDSAEPPQPLTDAKNAAVTLIQQLKDADQAGFVSFGTAPSSPIDSPLSTNHSLVEQKLQALIIHPSPDQNTNLGGGLLSAFAELTSKDHNPGSKGVIVALTDGIATDPSKAGDASYPQEFAADAASKIRAAGIQLYTVGLGKDVNVPFLQSIATDQSHYYSALTSSELQAIYSDIATKICEKRPAIIEIITRIVPPTQSSL